MNYKQTLLQSPQIDAVRDKTLSFGCEVECKDTGDGRQRNVGNRGHIVHIYPAAYGVNWNDNQTISVITDIYGQTKIIGHTPTLADYLRVLDKDIVNLRYETNHLFVQVRSGTFVTFNLTGDLLDEENAAIFVSLIEGV